MKENITNNLHNIPKPNLEQINIKFNNMMEVEATGGNYFVKFNNKREVQTRGIPVRVEFNNSK